MGLRNGTPYTQFDSISSGRIYRTKNGLIPLEKPNYIDPEKAATESTFNIFGGKKNTKNRYKLIIKNNKDEKILSLWVYGFSLRKAKKQLLNKLTIKLKEKNIYKQTGLLKNIKYSIETYYNKKLIKKNNYVFNL